MTAGRSIVASIDGYINGSRYSDTEVQLTRRRGRKILVRQIKWTKTLKVKSTCCCIGIDGSHTIKFYLCSIELQLICCDSFSPSLSLLLLVNINSLIGEFLFDRFLLLSYNGGIVAAEERSN